MAPSGEHRIEDLGAATVQAAAVAASNAAAALRAEVGRLHTEGKGLTVTKSCEEATARAGAAEKLFATLAATAKALKIREDAAKAWNRNAPKDSEIEAARKAIRDASQRLKDAAAASGDTSAAKTALENAQKKLKELNDRRKQADEAYGKAEKRADLELAKIAPQDISDDAPGSGTPTPDTTSPGSPSTGTGNPSTGAPSKTTGGTPKPSSTPSTTPSSTKPTETNGSGDDLSSLLTALASQQQQPQSSQQSQPTAQATPAAATPQQTQQPEKDKDLSQDKANPWDKILGADGILDTGDLAGIIGTPLTLGGGSTPTHATPAAVVTPSAPASPAPSATGLSASATANAQPVTSGTSATGLHTSTDVTGRSGEPRSAFSVGPETKTSGATGGASGSAPATTAGTRPMGGSGMPMVPMGGMGGPGGGSKDRDQAQTTSAAGSAESDLLHGRHTVSEAVPGGTIAQKDHPRHRGEDAA